MPQVLCIDARLWGIKHTGIGRYVENLVTHLPRDPYTRLVLITSEEFKNEPLLAPYPKYYAKYHPYSFLSQLEMLWLLLKIRPNLLHVPHFSIPIFWPGKMVVTIHDLIKHYSRGKDTTTRNHFLYWFKYLGYLVIVWLAVNRSSHIMVPAKYWKKILIEKYYLSENKISVTYEGVSGLFFQPPSNFARRFIRPYVVYTGNLYPHKNVGRLIEAIGLLKGRCRLEVVCARSVFESRLPKSKYVEFLGRLSDTDLISVYKNSIAFVFPSLIEGFGLPGLEAMAVGTPVIAANASCLPEIYADAAVYFDPYDPHDIANKISQVLSSSSLRRQLIKKGKQQLTKYSWEKMSQQTWQIYRRELL
jgi:glycosyltransferase involved in cell wall biosynthesis